MNLRAIKTIWTRELKVQLRDKSNLISSVARPITWFLIFGSGFGAARFAGLNVDYREFLFPGVIAMSVLFTSMRSGISVIWDREFGFMKEILVSPASRYSIMAGKVLGTATIAITEGALIMVIGPFFGAKITPISFAVSLAILFLMSLSLVSIGLIISVFMKTFEGFQTLMTFIIMPMFFLSGAIFPLNQIPAWMTPLTTVNPLTHGVDALHIALLGMGRNAITVDITVIVAFAAVTMAVGTQAFKNRD
jgi:ABC-2 type transport system permease protein